MTSWKKFHNLSAPLAAYDASKSSFLIAHTTRLPPLRIFPQSIYTTDEQIIILSF